MYINIFIYSGSLKYLKRNQVKLHDNVLRLIQEREAEKKERQMLFEIVKEIRDDLKLLVRLIIILIIIYIYIQT